MSKPGYQGIRRTLSRDALLDAAEILIGSESFAAVSIDDIVDRAGVAKGTFYNHFVDKRDIGNHLARRIRHDMRERIAEAKTKSADPAMHLAIAMSVFLSLSVQRPQRAKILITLLVGTTDSDASMNAPIRTNLERGQSDGRFQFEEITSVLTFILGTVSAGMRYIMQQNQSGKNDTFVRNLIRHTLLGLGLEREEAERIAGVATLEYFSPKKV